MQRHIARTAIGAVLCLCAASAAATAADCQIKPVESAGADRQAQTIDSNFECLGNKLDRILNLLEKQPEPEEEEPAPDPARTVTFKGITVTLELAALTMGRRGEQIVAELSVTNANEDDMLALIVRQDTSLRVRGEPRARGVSIEGFAICKVSSSGSPADACARRSPDSVWALLSPGMPYTVTLATREARARAAAKAISLTVRMLFKEKGNKRHDIKDIAFSNVQLEGG